MTPPAKKAAPPKRPGRPATGEAKSSTERSAARRERLLQAGHKTIHPTISPEGAQALALLVQQHGTQDAAVDFALQFAARAAAIDQKNHP